MKCEVFSVTDFPLFPLISLNTKSSQTGSIRCPSRLPHILFTLVLKFWWYINIITSWWLSVFSLPAYLTIYWSCMEKSDVDLSWDLVKKVFFVISPRYFSTVLYLGKNIICFVISFIWQLDLRFRKAVFFLSPLQHMENNGTCQSNKLEMVQAWHLTEPTKVSLSQYGWIAAHQLVQHVACHLLPWITGVRNTWWIFKNTVSRYKLLQCYVVKLLSFLK